MEPLSPTDRPSQDVTDAAPRGVIRFELGRADDHLVIDELEKAAVAAAAAGGLREDEAHFLGVAIREAVVNAVRHGRAENGGCAASVQVCVSPEGVLVATVRDRGPGFDPCAVPDPCAAGNVERGSGRGLFFMRQFADRVFFSFPRQGGAVVRLEKDLRRP